VKSNPIIYQDNNEISNNAVPENQSMLAVSITESVKSDRIPKLNSKKL
jgi:hypothetical protein